MTFLGQDPQVTEFLDCYDEGFQTGICGLTEDEGPDPDKVAFILVRTAIESRNQEECGKQKFVLGIHISNFGYMITIDLVSTSKAFHRQMLADHVVNMGWPQFENVAKTPEETYNMPFEWAGGFVGYDGENFSFSGQSGDFGGDMFGRDVNYIAQFCASVCGLAVAENKDGNPEVGKEFCQSLLDVSLEYKLKPDFYERVVEKLLPHYRKVTGQQVAGLITMKVADRLALEPDADPTLLIVEEMGQFGNFFLISRIASMKEIT